MDVGGGDQRKCVNETAYHHLATGAAGLPGVCANEHNVRLSSVRWWGEGQGDVWCQVSRLIMALPAQSGRLIG